jgi:hypothetical protein
MVSTLLLLGFASAARADIGPPPTCEAGTHREYLYGNHCVRDGFHLEASPEGGTREVANPAAAVDPAAPVDPATPVVPAVVPVVPEVTPAVAPAAPAAPARDEARCAATSSGASFLLVGFAGVLAARRRRVAAG